MATPRSRSVDLMRYGQAVGARFVAGAFNFDEHRWRRALVAYEQLEKAVGSLDAVWNDGGFGTWFESYARPLSYDGMKSSRPTIHQRVGLIAGLAPLFEPSLGGKAKPFPKPAGRLRIGPDV